MSMEIRIDNGNGLHTRPADDKLAVYYEPNGNMHLETAEGVEGIFVEDLNGQDGVGGSRVDGHTTVVGNAKNLTNGTIIHDFVDVNRDVVNHIFTLGLYRPLRRDPTQVVYTSTVKDVIAMCNEIVAPIYYNGQQLTSYHPIEGELIQLVTNPVFRIFQNSSTGINMTSENMNRVTNNNQETKAMFVITDIVYGDEKTPPKNAYWVYSMKLMCIYSSIPEYVVGTLYEGSQNIDPSQGRV